MKTSRADNICTFIRKHAIGLYNPCQSQMQYLDSSQFYNTYIVVTHKQNNNTTDVGLSFRVLRPLKASRSIKTINAQRMNNNLLLSKFE